MNESSTNNISTFENTTSDLFNNNSADLLSPIENNFAILGKNTIVNDPNTLFIASGIFPQRQNKQHL